MHNSSDKQPFQKKVEFATHYTAMRRWWWYSPGLTKFPSISYKKSSHHLFVWEPAKTGTGVGKRGGGDTSELEESGHWFSVIISGKFCILFLYLPKHLSYLEQVQKPVSFTQTFTVTYSILRKSAMCSFFVVAA